MRYVLLTSVLSITLSTLACDATGQARVIDGDTLDYDGVRYRLFAIDAPEGNQPGGDDATRALRRLIALKGIGEITKKDTDRYGRTVAIFGTINCEMVRQGYAWAYVKYSRMCAKEEKAARAAKVGLWARDGAVAPWIWRRQ